MANWVNKRKYSHRHSSRGPNEVASEREDVCLYKSRETSQNEHDSKFLLMAYKAWGKLDFCYQNARDICPCSSVSCLDDILPR